MIVEFQNTRPGALSVGSNDPAIATIGSYESNTGAAVRFQDLTMLYAREQELSTLTLRKPKDENRLLILNRDCQDLGSRVYQILLPECKISYDDL